MDVIYIVLPLAIGFAGVALAAFYWAVRRGQFDDLDTPPCRVLFEDAGGTDDERPIKQAGPP